MDQQAIAQLMIPVRLALEAARTGRAVQHNAFYLMQCTTLTKLVTESGFGTLEIALLEKTQAELLEVLEHGETTGEWTFKADLIADLMQVVNEHDRQLRETRLQVISAACEALDRKANLSKDGKSSKDF
jgi:hypothetical protein